MLYDLGEFCIENCRVIGKTDAQQVAVRYDIDVCDHQYRFRYVRSRARLMKTEVVLLIWNY